MMLHRIDHISQINNQFGIPDNVRTAVFHFPRQELAVKPVFFRHLLLIGLKQIGQNLSLSGSGQSVTRFPALLFTSLLLYSPHTGIRIDLLKLSRNAPGR